MSLVDKLRRHGVNRPQLVIDEAKRAGLGLADALALLEKETGIPWRNVFGGDYGPSYRGRPPYYEEPVTKAKVRKLLAQPLNNGVGATQLTYRPFVEQAQTLGGAHLPRYQMRVGFKVLATAIHTYGEQEGFARYNGTGPAAEAYGRDAVAKARRWKERLA